MIRLCRRDQRSSVKSRARVGSIIDSGLVYGNSNGLRQGQERPSCPVVPGNVIQAETDTSIEGLGGPRTAGKGECRLGVNVVVQEGPPRPRPWLVMADLVLVDRSLRRRVAKESKFRLDSWSSPAQASFGSFGVQESGQGP